MFEQTHRTKLDDWTSSARASGLVRKSQRFGHLGAKRRNSTKDCGSLLASGRNNSACREHFLPHRMRTQNHVLPSATSSILKSSGQSVGNFARSSHEADCNLNTKMAIDSFHMWTDEIAVSSKQTAWTLRHARDCHGRNMHVLGKYKELIQRIIPSQIKGLFSMT